MSKKPTRPAGVEDTVPTKPVAVHLKCQKCGYRFIAAHIIPGAYWAEGLTPRKTAQYPCCPKCNRRPPLAIVEVQELPPVEEANKVPVGGDIRRPRRNPERG